MIAIINYGSGNVAALMNIFNQHRIPYFLANKPEELAAADRFLLPGVGAFDPTMTQLTSSGVLDELTEQVMNRGKRVLGICVGMHLLGEGSEEGQMAGLGWIKGFVRKIDTSRLTAPPHLPHMGWNSIDIKETASLFSGVDPARGFYFLHSYYFDATVAHTVAATVQYGSELPCAIESNNIFGVQFHPEKSHSNGVNLLRNFAELPRC